MRIEFYRTDQDQDLHFDIIIQNTSMITQRRSVVKPPVDVEKPGKAVITPVVGYFMNEQKLVRHHFPFGQTVDAAFTWMIQCGFFSLWWVIRLLLGNVETLEQACRASTKSFFPTLQAMMSYKPNKELITQDLNLVNQYGGADEFRTRQAEAEDEISMKKYFTPEKLQKIAEQPMIPTIKQIIPAESRALQATLSATDE